MIIDFHTHIFPDQIAYMALHKLQQIMIEQNEDREFPLATDGTLAGQRAMMKREGIDMSILLPVATKGEQTESINNFAETLRFDDLISFGTVYPFQKDWEEVIEGLAERGFMGLKLHPEYQQCYIDSKESIRIFKKAEQLGLMVVFHAGHDPEYNGQDHGVPIRIKHLLEEVEGSNVIAAHMGGMECADDTERYLVGTPLIFDTSYVSKIMDMDQYKRIIINHGVDKIIFGSDTPWQDPMEALDALKSCNLDQESYDKITYKNALNLLEKYKRI